MASTEEPTATTTTSPKTPPTLLTLLTLPRELRDIISTHLITTTYNPYYNFFSSPSNPRETFALPLNCLHPPSQPNLLALSRQFRHEFLTTLFRTQQFSLEIQLPRPFAENMYTMPKQTLRWLEEVFDLEDGEGGGECKIRNLQFRLCDLDLEAIEERRRRDEADGGVPDNNNIIQAGQHIQHGQQDSLIPAYASINLVASGPVCSGNWKVDLELDEGWGRACVGAVEAHGRLVKRVKEWKEEGRRDEGLGWDEVQELVLELSNGSEDVLGTLDW